MSNKAVVLMLGISLCCGGLAQAGTWTTLDYPGAKETEISGIDNGRIVGSYSDDLGRHGFIYDAGSWLSVDAPDAVETVISAIDGANVLGYFRRPYSSTRGFLFNGTDWTILDVPPCITGVDGTNIVGYRWTSGIMVLQGFIYDGSNISFIDKPDAIDTVIYAIEGSKIVGTYRSRSWHYCGFIYDGTNWFDISVPGLQTSIYGIEGNRLVGSYIGSDNITHGLLFEGTIWSTLDFPGASHTRVTGIEGDNLVGVYLDDSGTHGFAYTIPEPATIFLLGFRMSVVRKRFCK